MAAGQFFVISILLYAAGAGASLLLGKVDRYANYVASVAALFAALTGMAWAVPVVAGGDGFTLDLTGFIPIAKLIIRVDQLSAFMTLAISLLTAATSVYSLSYLEEYSGKGKGLLGFFMNVFVGSMILVVTTGDAFYFLFFWELMTLASYFLVSFEQEKKESINAGLVYLIIAHVGTALIMLSFLIIASKTGSYDFATFKEAPLSDGLKTLAFIMAFLGFGAKAGIIPLHIWLPQAHPAAPSNISALMSGVMIKTAIYGIIRVAVDFLGASDWWWGLVVLIAGAVSAVLGVMYALVQHDLKRLLAFHSVENIGIILMGVGAGMLGAALDQPVLAVLGLMAGLYHLINHATFKGLLFLGAGSVLYRTHANNMEQLGGLGKRMPITALAFLVGAAAISALPPFNGFVSEWYTYHSLFLAAKLGNWWVTLAASVVIVMLAFTGALAVMCFVKAYGVTFAGSARSHYAETAREVPSTMIAGMFILVFAIIALGIGAPWLAPYFSSIAASVLNQPAVPASSGLIMYPAISSQGTLSTPLIAVLLVGLVTLPLLLVLLWGGFGAGKRMDEAPWACGFTYSSRMGYTASSFAQPLRVIFRAIYAPNTRVKGPRFTSRSYFEGRVHYESHAVSLWENYLYKPLVAAVMRTGTRIQKLQAGSIHLYLLYIIIILVGFLLMATR
ncbi:hydrogenase 4 subunit B [Calderihabitans maritimus]|uniref:Hydrogenase 4 subunit B n=1 Tax=Calderihabitans maritimus TaxID=1246530 RepID=A0A1Z5HNS1_9FIRM|nr:hydrogenase 4 subunit B [Calderihabitans maritimus]GAW91098.1 hydrogenase 4 subunit B [Calderihabitans maritimus]